MDSRSLVLPVPSNLLSPIQTFRVTVLLVDDQPIVAEAVRHMLADQSDIVLHYCSDPGQAMALAASVKPTVILQDLVMPEFDGLLLVKYFKANPSTHDIPLVVLSSKEDPQVKAEAFSLGANDYIVKLPDRLELIARIRYHSSAYIRLLERNEAFQRLNDSQKILEKELAEAAAYVRSHLPNPLQNGIKTDWRFIPSTQLSGDSFGYHWLDQRYFAIYLLDVCGHGVGAALHSLSVMNAIKMRNLPGVDYHDPRAVLATLNTAFQMEQHNNMFFTIWYGVFDKENGQLRFSSGGHPPALLLRRTQNQWEIKPLTTGGLVIGAVEGVEFQNADFQLKEGDLLYVFSDGVYEIPRPDGTVQTFQEFFEQFSTLARQRDKLDTIVQMAQVIPGQPSFADDFSIIELAFKKIPVS